MGNSALQARDHETAGPAPEERGPEGHADRAAAPAALEARAILAGGGGAKALAELLHRHPDQREPIVAAIQQHPAGGNAMCGEVLDEMAVPKGPEPLLRVGSRGEPVVRLQQGLIKHGATISADGAFGPQTAGAVMAFQLQNDLVADGIVGPKTWGALDGAPAAEQPHAEPKAPAAEPVQDAHPTPTTPAPTTTASAGGAGGATTAGEKYREQYVSQLLYFEGAQEGDAKFESIMSHEGLEAQRKAADGKTFSTCNSFSGIMQTMAEQKSGVKMKAKINLYVMDPKWREKNLPEGAFHPGGGSDRPKPGDILIFSQLDGRTFAHMGNFIEGPIASDDGLEEWQCIDGGQGQAGKYVDGVCVQQGHEMIGRTHIKYNPANNQTVPKWGNPRMVYGWVDIAMLAAE